MIVNFRQLINKQSGLADVGLAQKFSQCDLLSVVHSPSPFNTLVN